MGRPRKITFPVSLEKWLHVCMPRKRLEDRMKIFREWRRFSLRVQFKREPTDQEIEDDIKLIRETKFKEGDRIHDWAFCLKDFLPVFHKENRRIRAQTAATK